MIMSLKTSIHNTVILFHVKNIPKRIFYTAVKLNLQLPNAPYKKHWKT